jgi:high affinity Mn2+ porin
MQWSRVLLCSRLSVSDCVVFGMTGLAFLSRPAHAGEITSPPEGLVSGAQAETALPPPEPVTRLERLYAGFQSTYIWQRKPTMPAAYTLPDTNSLQQEAETGYTLSATLFLGARPWKNTEIFINPEAIQAVNISDLHGLGGMSNSENQKGGKQIPTLYLARAFVRQTISFGGETLTVDPGQNRFAAAKGSRRLVLTAGTMSVIDVFDSNPYAHDGRTQFINWALMAHGAYDFAADTRGYTWGIAAEYFYDAWALRLGRYLVPKESNGMTLDWNFLAHYGDNLEVEYAYSVRGLAGKARVLGFRNYERMGAFGEAVDHAAGGTPTMASVRRNQVKYGFGIAAEQSFHRDGGFFLHGSWNDGRTETYSFAEIERSLSAGATMWGPLWHRPGDSMGVAWVMNGLSQEHRRYLAQGGLGFLIGDGRLNYRPEQLFEVYYSAVTFRGLWLSLDFQHIANPAYNADRGPVRFMGIRLHLEI